MSKIVPGKIIRNMLHIFCLAIIITAALSLGSASGTDGFIARITGTTTTKAAAAPELTTDNASDITTTSATLNCNLTSLGTATRLTYLLNTEQLTAMVSRWQVNLLPLTVPETLLPI